MEHHLAQVNVARLIAPIHDPRIAEFVAQLDEINALADRASGFVWRLASESGNATDVVFSGDPLVIVNMSVWESVEALKDFTYASNHVRAFRDRAKWFEKAAKPHYCLWWVPIGHRPGVEEGRERLTSYQEHGPTPYSFWFSKQFPAPLASETAAMGS